MHNRIVVSLPILFKFFCLIAFELNLLYWFSFWLNFFSFSDISVRDWLKQIDLGKYADEYGSLLEEQHYHSIGDLLENPPSKDDLKGYGITAGRDINHILNRLKVASGTGMEVLCSCVSVQYHMPNLCL